MDFFKTQHGDDICSRSMEWNQEVCQSMYNWLNLSDMTSTKKPWGFNHYSMNTIFIHVPFSLKEWRVYCFYPCVSVCLCVCLSITNFIKRFLNNYWSQMLEISSHSLFMYGFIFGPIRHKYPGKWQLCSFLA